jgi:hypothetical protein
MLVYPSDIWSEGQEIGIIADYLVFPVFQVSKSAIFLDF